MVSKIIDPTFHPESLPDPLPRDCNDIFKVWKDTTEHALGRAREAINFVRLEDLKRMGLAQERFMQAAQTVIETVGETHEITTKLRDFIQLKYWAD